MRDDHGVYFLFFRDRSQEFNVKNKEGCQGLSLLFISTGPVNDEDVGVG